MKDNEKIIQIGTYILDDMIKYYNEKYSIQDSKKI